MHPLIHAFSYGFLKLLGGKEVVHFSCVTSVAHFFICMGYDFMNKVNERVRKIRKAAKLSQEKVGKLLGLKTSTYSQKEREGNFNGDDLVTLANYFKVDVREFLYDDIETIDPIIIIPDECYMLNERERHVITMYRNLSKEKQKEIFAFVFNTFKNK